MTRVTRGAASRALICLCLATLPTVSASAQDPEFAALEKELQKLDKKIAAAEARLADAREACKEEFKKLRNEKVQGRIAAVVARLRETHLEGLTGSRILRAKTTRKIEKELRATLEEQVGPRLSGIMSEDLTANLAARAAEPSFDAAKVVSQTVTDRFPDPDYDAAFKDEIKGLLSPRLAEALAERETLKRELEVRRRAAVARAAGLPAGMVRVEGGKVRIGMDLPDLLELLELAGRDRKDIEKFTSVWLNSYPAHVVTIDPFFIDVNEVTCRAYAAFVEDANRRAPIWWPEGNLPDELAPYPVTGISWEEADAFCRWVGRRLPTEQEWEAAARSGRRFDGKQRFYWSWGDVYPKEGYANGAWLVDHPVRRESERKFLRANKDERPPPIIPVAFFPQGSVPKLSVNDMVGNATEYTSSPFVPYPGRIGARELKRLSAPMGFNPNQVVVRGGDGLKRQEMATTFWRVGAGRTVAYPYVGFRTAASTVKGKDRLDFLMEGGVVKRLMVDFDKLPSDLKERRPHAMLETENSDYFTALRAGGWTDITKPPTRARFIVAASRRCDDFQTEKALPGMSIDQRAVFMGFLHLDLPTVEPKLEPGTYLVLYKPEYVPEEEPEVADDGKAEKPKRGRKSRKGKAKKEEPKPVPEAILFRKTTESARKAVRHEKFFAKVLDEQRTAILPDTDDGGFEVLWCYPIKYRGSKSFVLSVRFKTEEGALAGFE